jgi:hypothetical protein
MNVSFEYGEGGSIREFCPICRAATIHKIGGDGKLYCSHCLEVKAKHVIDSGLGGTLDKDWDETQSEEYKLKELESKRRRKPIG